MGRGSEPMYLHIYRDLRRKIFAGSLSNGDCLPSEAQLCSEYGVSRETARRGLRELEEEGLIYSRPKIGYFVGKPDHSELRLYLSDELAEGRKQYLDIHGVSADGEISGMLGIPEGQFVIRFSQMTYSPLWTPLAFEEKYIPYERAYPSVESEMGYAVLPDITLAKMNSFTVYTGIRVSAVAAGEELAVILQCAAGDPLLLIERLYTEQDDRRIGYSRFYAKQPDGFLNGHTGNME